jgi:WhiB family redox-sensing transcriptional regulator
VDFNSVQFFRRFLPIWSSDAACAGTDTNTFFPEDDRAANDDVVLKARVICARCPMRKECLEWALENLTPQNTASTQELPVRNASKRSRTEP